MSEPLKIAVIGAGLIGLSCADALMQAAPNGSVAVTIFEKNNAPVRGTSFCNSGMIHPSQSQSWSEDGQRPNALSRAASQTVFDLATRSQALLVQNFERLGLRDMLSRPKGCVQIYSDIAAAQNAQTCFNGFGINSSVFMDDVKTFGHAALLFPDDMSGNARLYGDRLASYLTSCGVNIIYGVQNIRFRPQDDGVTVQVSGTQGSDVKLTSILAHFDHVILAVGPQSRPLMRQLGLSIQIDPVKGYAVNYARPAIALLPDMPIMDAASRSALTVFDDHIRLSGTWDAPDETALLSRWQQIAPHLMDALGDPLSHWTGYRPVSRAGRPYISATSIPNLWVNTGHGHLGWTLCAGSGELMARMILDGDKDKRFSYAG